MYVTEARFDDIVILSFDTVGTWDVGFIARAQPRSLQDVRDIGYFVVAFRKVSRSGQSGVGTSE